MIPLATLEQVRDEAKVASTDTTDDSLLMDALRHCSERWQQETGKQFTAYSETRYFDALSLWQGGSLHGYELLLDKPLLSVTTLTNGNAVVIDSADYLLLPRNDTDKHSIYYDGGWTYSDIPYGAIQVDGVWCVRSRLSEAWRSSGDTVQSNPLSSSGTSLTVSDADGLDANGYTPRFSAGQLIRIESEYLEVLAANTTTNVLTVRRGVNGTTAASHVQGTVIDTFIVEPEVSHAVARWAGYLYKRRGEFQKSTYDGVISTSWPVDIPGDVQNVMARYLSYRTLGI